MGVDVAILGFGWVGKSMVELFPNAVVYDEPKILEGYEDPREQEAALLTGRMAVNECEVSFVCVPTPLKETGELDTSIVEEIVEWCESDLIVIRSTVNPGTTDKLVRRTGKQILMQPEFLGETPNHPMLDPTTRQWVVIGGEPHARRQLIDLYSTVYNANTNIRQLTAYEAEVAKLTENRAIGFKVMQMHELAEVCEAAGVDYYTIRDTVYGDDPRFNLWFTLLYPDRGFNSSKCLVKDIPAWSAWAEGVGVKADMTQKLIEKSNEYDVRNHTV